MSGVWEETSVATVQEEWQYDVKVRSVGTRECRNEGRTVGVRRIERG